MIQNTKYVCAYESNRKQQNNSKKSYSLSKENVLVVSM